MPRVPGTPHRNTLAYDSAKGLDRSAKAQLQGVKLPPPVQIPKPAAQKTAKLYSTPASRFFSYGTLQKVTQLNFVPSTCSGCW